MLSSIKTQRLDAFALGSLGFLFLGAMHYFQNHPGGSGLSNSFNAFSWIPVSVFIGSTLFIIVARGLLRYSSLTPSLIFCVGLLFVPALFPDAKDAIVTGKLYGLTAGLLMFLGLQQLCIDISRLALLMLFVVFGVWIEAAIGFAQHFQWLPEGLAGYEAENPIPFGILRQRNVMASFMATGLVFSAFLLPISVQLSHRFRKFTVVVCLLSPLLVIPIVFLNYSRLGWMGAALGSLLLLPYLFKQAGARLAAIWTVSAAVGVLIGFVLVAANEDAMSMVAVKATITDSVRENLYPVSIRLFLENWLFGVGYGNFESAYNAFAANQFAIGLAQPTLFNGFTHPHNELLYWAIEGGIIPLIGLLLASWYVLKSILNAKAEYQLALVGLFFPIVLHTQLEFPFYHSVVHWMIFVIIIFIADYLGNERKTLVVKPTILVGTAGLIIPVFTTLFMATTLQASAILYRYENDPGMSPDIIYKIINPMVWRERILFNIRGNAMLLGLQQGDTSQVQPFIVLLEESIKDKPRWRRYQDLIFAYGFLGQHEKAASVRKEAEYRFPQVLFADLSEGAFSIMSLSETEDQPEGFLDSETEASAVGRL